MIPNCLARTFKAEFTAASCHIHKLLTTTGSFLAKLKLNLELQHGMSIQIKANIYSE